MKKCYFIAVLFFVSQFVCSQTPFYPTSNANGHNFGNALDIDGDEIIVSSRATTVFPVTEGSVYLFEQIGNDIVQTETFSPDNVSVTDRFGSSVSIDTDFIAIGSPEFNNTGSTYLYQKIGADWEFIQHLFAPTPSTGAMFGHAVVRGNYLFVSAIGDETSGQPTNTDSGVVYIYTFSGTEWTFLQSFEITGSYHFGDQIRVEGDTLIISSIGDSSSKIFHRYTLVGGLWQFAGSSQPFGSLEQLVGDFQIADNNLYLISRTEANQQIQIIDYTSWDILNTVNLPPDDQIYTTLAVADDTMFVGSSGYILQVTRKFPVLYFKKIANQWLYQYSLNGTGPAGADDYFGQTLAIDGPKLVIGAPQEGEILPTGQAYYVNTGTLSTTDFANRSSVLFPNPVSTSFSILTDGAATHEKIEIYSIHGQLLLTIDGNSAMVDATSFGSGIYFAKIQHLDGSRQTFRFIKS